MLDQKIIEVLKSKGEPMRPGDIASAAGADKAEVDKVIKKLVKEGKMESPKRCFYDLVK